MVLVNTEAEASSKKSRYKMRIVNSNCCNSHAGFTNPLSFLSLSKRLFSLWIQTPSFYVSLSLTLFLSFLSTKTHTHKHIHKHTYAISFLFLSFFGKSPPVSINSLLFKCFIFPALIFDLIFYLQ